MYKGTELPQNYNQLTIAQKEALWLGTLLVYEDSDYFDEDYWVDDIVNCSENTIYEDELIVFYKCYNAEYKLLFKKAEITRVGVFEDFFIPDNLREYYDMRILGDEYKDISLRDYLRSKAFPVNAEFWM